jgi:predicted protein tyrosine phosphatase
MTLEFPFRVAVTSRVRLEAAFWRHGATHVLSLVDPGKAVWRGHQLPKGRHVTLRFEDDTDPSLPLAPRREHIESILAFGRAIEPGSMLLAHCEAGISRSPAAVFLVLAQAMGREHAAGALEKTYRVRDIAHPNALMVALGADVLGWPELPAVLVEGVRRFSQLELPSVGRGLT